MKSQVIVKKEILGHIQSYIDLDSFLTLIITDNAVPAIYCQAVASQAANAFIFTMSNGEIHKSLETYYDIISFMLEKGFSRNDRIIAVGGGVVGDMAGFVASTYMRGIDFYYVPTTLLSQVDASVGGKTAIDVNGIKNVIGAFYFPKTVIIDPQTLNTLPQRQLYNGLSEAIKMAACFDKQLFSLIENSTNLKDDLPIIIKRAVAIKESVVANDPFDKDQRRVLNFGHTIGHAVEAASKGDILHGEAVGIGMLRFAGPNAAPRIKAVLEKYQLPTECNIEPSVLRQYIVHDKKSVGDNIVVVKVDEIGSYKFESINIDQIL